MTYNNYPPQGTTYQAPQPHGGPQVPPRQGAQDGGYLYPNDKKQRAEQPDQKGKIKLGDEIVRRIMAGEREFYISAWNKQDQKGQRFLSIKLKGIDLNAARPPYGGQQPSYTPPLQQPQYAPQQAPQQPYHPPQPYQGGGNAGPVQHQSYAPQQHVNPQGRNVPPPQGPGGFPNDEIPF